LIFARKGIMTWWKEIRGLSVVSLAEGKELGKIDALLVDVDITTVRWLQLRKGGVFGRTRVISVDAVQAVGENAITVDSETSAVLRRESSEAQKLAQDKRRIIGNRVLTNKGRLLGEIRDYEIDVETFKITRYEIGKGDLLGTRTQPVAADYVLTIGPDAVLVEAAIESELLPAAAPEAPAAVSKNAEALLPGGAIVSVPEDTAPAVPADTATSLSSDEVEMPVLPDVEAARPADIVTSSTDDVEVLFSQDKPAPMPEGFGVSFSEDDEAFWSEDFEAESDEDLMREKVAQTG
jgi:uncharacterized protein YrrD